MALKTINEGFISMFVNVLVKLSPGSDYLFKILISVMGITYYKINDVDGDNTFDFVPFTS